MNIIFPLKDVICNAVTLSCLKATNGFTDPEYFFIMKIVFILIGKNKHVFH